MVVAVGIGQAGAGHDQRVVQQAAFAFLGLAHALQVIGHLFHVQGVDLGQLFE